MCLTFPDPLLQILPEEKVQGIHLNITQTRGILVDLSLHTESQPLKLHGRGKIGEKEKKKSSFIESQKSEVRETSSNS